MRIPRLEEVIEEIASVGVVAHLGAFHELGLAVSHVSRPAGSNFGEEDLVDTELVDEGHRAALKRMSEKGLTKLGLAQPEREETYDQMPLGRSSHQVQRIPILRTLQHPKRLSKAQVSKNIHSQIITPITHIPSRAPPFLLINHAHSTLLAPRSDLLAESPHVGEHVPLHLLDGGVGEAVAEDAALAGVDLAVARVVRVGGRVDEGVVEVGFAYVGAVGVDGAEGGGGVEGKPVGGEADDGACKVVLALTGAMEGVVVLWIGEW